MNTKEMNRTIALNLFTTTDIMGMASKIGQVD